MKPKPKRRSVITQAILEAVLGGASTVKEIVAVMGTRINEEVALAAGRRWLKWSNGKWKADDAHVAELGRRNVVAIQLACLCRDGRVRRVKKGVYAPPLVVKKSLAQLVLDAVLAGASEIEDVLARVGHAITAAEAANAARRRIRSKSGKCIKDWDAHQLVDAGKRRMVSNTLGRLVRSGQVRRIGPGVYAPPLPKLHEPQAG